VPLPPGVDPAAAFAAEQALVLDVVTSLTPDEWAAPSGCAGWTTHDLVAHMAAICRIVTDPGSLTGTGEITTEAAQEVHVADRRSWSDADVLAEYATASAGVAAVLPALVEQVDVVFPAGDLGTYPLPVIACSLPFDHTTHLRADLVAPRGSVDRTLPAPDATVLGASVAWVVAALPQQVTSGVPAFAGEVRLVLDGPGGRTVALRAGDRSGGLAVTVPAEDGPAPVATVTAPTDTLVWWATRRADWRRHVTIAGDAAVAGPVLDAIHVF
jgi:uncharacterized protein (TIGR03083 family)